MSDERYNRWQGRAIDQLSVAVALIWGLSVAGVGAGFSLLQDQTFNPDGSFRFWFVGSMLLLIFAALFSCAAVVTRLLDFRLTARKVRKERHSTYEKSLTMFGLGANAYGKATWGRFWLGCISFLFGAALLVLSVANGYRERWSQWQPKDPAATATQS